MCREGGCDGEAAETDGGTVKRCRMQCRIERAYIRVISCEFELVESLNERGIPAHFFPPLRADALRPRCVRLEEP